MTPEQFDQTLRSYVKRRPFFPFIVELNDSRRILIEDSHVGFGGGVAGFINGEARSTGSPATKSGPCSLRPPRPPHDSQAIRRSLRAFLRRRPFRPFLIDFVSGDRVRVTHPEAVYPVGNLWAHVAGPGRQHRVFAPGAVCQLLDPPEPAEA